MEPLDIHEHARRLMEAHGWNAIAEAGQKARAFQDQGDEAQARVWREIQKSLMLMRGPSAS
jgi:hypothetical protein